MRETARNPEVRWRYKISNIGGRLFIGSRLATTVQWAVPRTSYPKSDPLKYCLSLLSCLSLSLFGPVIANRSVHADSATTQQSSGISDTKPESGIFVEVDGKFMVPYQERIPGTDLTIEMIPVPGGSFKMGSPEDETDRNGDEGPQFVVNVDPMWVAKTEITWAQFKEFMNLYTIFKSFESDGVRLVTDDNKADAITAPTALYDPSHTYKYGEEPQQAAVTMTQYSAQQFTKWLSKVSSTQYRLPTEAEWEYAARGGTETTYYWGDDVDGAQEQAWYFDTVEEEGQQEVGLLKTNSFGLHDMLGNVAEWTVNQHTDDYQQFAEKAPLNAIEVVAWPETGTSCVVRGGSWELNANEIRCASRLVSDDIPWKKGDPNLPLSPWWFVADPSRGVGFRLFRSHKPLGKELITKFWEPSAKDVRDDVETRLIGGRGGMGLVDPELPQAIKEQSK